MNYVIELNIFSQYLMGLVSHNTINTDFNVLNVDNALSTLDNIARQLRSIRTKPEMEEL